MKNYTIAYLHNNKCNSISRVMSNRKSNYPLASIIICNYNGGDSIIQALNSLTSQTFQNYETILLDNGSSDDSVHKIKIAFPKVTVIENNRNYGFAKGNNIGVKSAHGKFICTVNQDVILQNDFLEKIINRFESAASDVGSIGGKILRFDKETIDSTGLILTKTRKFYDRGSGEKDTGYYDSEEEVFGVCAAAAVYRKVMLERVAEISGDSFFDERFFLLVEDIDLAWRARHAGYKSIYYPDAVCFHVRGGIGWKPKYKQYLSFRNRYYMILKNEYFRNLFLSSPRLLLYDITRFLYLLSTNKLLFKAIKEILSELKSINSERNKILSNSNLLPAKLRSWLK